MGEIQKAPSSTVGENPHLDDATPTPHTSDTSVIQVPVELQEGELLAGRREG